MPCGDTRSNPAATIYSAFGRRTASFPPPISQTLTCEFRGLATPLHHERGCSKRALIAAEPAVFCGDECRTSSPEVPSRSTHPYLTECETRRYLHDFNASVASEASRSIPDPKTGKSTFEVWRDAQNKLRHTPTEDGWGRVLQSRSGIVRALRLCHSL